MLKAEMEWVKVVAREIAKEEAAAAMNSLKDELRVEPSATEQPPIEDEASNRPLRRKKDA